MITNEILLAKLEERLDNFKADTKETLDAILVQATKTNGRVNELEDWKTRIETSIKASKFYVGIAGLVIGFFLEKIFSSWTTEKY